ncbi:hypothetical protein HanXRQr2_Chr07g0295861 [Helianthus annuus]|uniref:Uncharacterized protein n=1 Tax=Helianthus annuus TaxID=4232 RepID=A0A9K3ILC2_HELAN|nr:hypothetical protein HanXRQr2_Chr07g0295861 [Helianthus annuus]KAJ0556935.1 hypothetical protein HanIR_Chr07g0319421 [Helianthus annuus]KAJ0904798.1 hypothetical protein HanPSC8_Chr07g0286441 [Helianthus annuus]
MTHDSMAKISPTRTWGRESSAEMVVRMAGIVSRIITQSCRITWASGGATPETSAAGIWMTERWLWVVKEVMSWDRECEAVAVTARTVTRRLWWVARRWPSNNIGSKWPAPGLASIATCSCLWAIV